MTKKHYISLFIVLAIFAMLNFYPLNKYIMRPGDAYDVEQFIKVQDGDQDDKGSFSLMTVSMAKATPVTYLLAQMNEFNEVLKMESVRQEDETDEEYRLRQLKLMSDSQFNALYVAFTKANLPFDVSYRGVCMF